GQLGDRVRCGLHGNRLRGLAARERQRPGAEDGRAGGIDDRVIVASDSGAPDYRVRDVDAGLEVGTRPGDNDPGLTALHDAGGCLGELHGAGFVVDDGDRGRVLAAQADV